MGRETGRTTRFMCVCVCVCVCVAVFSFVLVVCPLCPWRCTRRPKKRRRRSVLLAVYSDAGHI